LDATLALGAGVIWDGGDVETEGVEVTEVAVVVTLGVVVEEKEVAVVIVGLPFFALLQ